MNPNKIHIQLEDVTRKKKKKSPRELALAQTRGIHKAGYSGAACHTVNCKSRGYRSGSSVGGEDDDDATATEKEQAAIFFLPCVCACACVRVSVTFTLSALY